MEFDLLQVAIGFGIGLLTGVIAMLIFNKVRSGSVSAVGVKQEYDDYRSQVEEHFEQTSKKFQNMTEQYQDLYEHLSVGATSLCAPGSVAAALADQSESVKPKQIESKEPQKGEDVQSSNEEETDSRDENEASKVVSEPSTAATDSVSENEAETKENTEGKDAQEAEKEAAKG